MAFDLGTAIAGASTGFAMGGPMGALAGGALGGFGGDILGSATKTGQTQFKAQLDPEVLKQQKALAEALGAQAAGAGPSLAQEQLKRATSQNIAQAAALAASQKGISPALAARQALQAGTMAQQESAGQAGLLKAQQQLASQQAYANLLAQQQSQALSKQSMEQAAEEANARAQAQQTAGLMGALGTLGSAYIGMQGKTPTPTSTTGPTPSQQISTLPQLTMPQMGSSAVQTPPPIALSEGGQVDGVSVDEGDSPLNDNVPAMLSPGEIVIPKSIVESDNPGEMARKFVEKTLKQKPNNSGFYANGGLTPDYIPPGYGGLGADAIPLATTFAQGYQEPTKEQKLADRIDFYKKQTGSNIIDPITERQIMAQLNKEEQETTAARAEMNAPQIAKAKMQYEQEAQRAAYLGKPAPALPEILGGKKAEVPQQTTPQASIVETPPIITPQAAKQAQQAQLGAPITGKPDESAAILNRMADIQKQKQDMMKEAMAKSEEADKALDAMQPQNFWADKSTGTKIAAGIALALGAYSSTISGGPNQAMQVIDSAINRDLQLQKEKYQRAKERGAFVRTAYADQVAMLGDQEAAELTLLNNYYKKIDMQLKMREANTTNDVQKLNIQKLRQDINQSAEANNYKRLERMTMLQATKGTPGELNPELLPDEARKRYVSDPEFGGLARNESAANKVSESLVSYRNAKEMLNTLKRIQATPGKSLNPQLKAEAEMAVKNLRGNLRGEIVGPGAVTPYEYGILNSMVTSPTDFFTIDAVTKSKFDALERKIDANMNNVAKAYMTTPPRLKPTEGNVVYVRVPGQQPVKIARSNLQAAQERAKAAGKTLEVSDVGF